MSARPGKGAGRSGRGRNRLTANRGLVALGAAVAALAVPLAAGLVGGNGMASAADGMAPLMSANLADVVPNSYIVVLKGEPSAQSMSSPTKAPTAPAFAATVRAQTSGAEVTHEFHASINGYAATMDAADLQEIRKDPDVAYVVPNKVYNTFGALDKLDNLLELGAQTENNPPWGLDRIDQRSPTLNTKYNFINTGKNVNAYVIDTGIRSTHTQFAGRVGTGFSVVDDGRGTEDCNNHGTHVAGITGGMTYGVAKDVTLEPIRVFDCAGATTTEQVITAVDWVTANHKSPAVANMSLGGPVDEALDASVAASIKSGVTYVVAAGNSNVDACTFTPARVPTAITVAALAKGDVRAGYSNFGACVDVFAPGSGILSSIARGGDTARAVFDGTSMAAPHVAGAVAVFLQDHPRATPAQVSRAMTTFALRNTVTDPQGSPNRQLFMSPLIMR